MDIDFIKNEFESIKDTKISIEDMFNLMVNKIDSLKKIYRDYIKKNNNPDMVLTLDSFHFQTKFIEIEYENYTRIFKLFIDRLYGDYYKFYKFIISDVISHIDTNINIRSNFPVYKDLQVNHYEFDNVINIHNEILIVVNELNSCLIKLEHENKMNQKYSESGININNLVSVNNYKNIVLSEKIKLIISCLNSYSSFQRNFLDRFLLKIKFIYGQISADIQLDGEAVSKSKLDKKLLEELEEAAGEVKKIFHDTGSEDSLEEEQVVVQKPKVSFKKLLWFTIFLQIVYTCNTPFVEPSKELIILN
jgi:hypothetical protein